MTIGANSSVGSVSLTDPPAEPSPVRGRIAAQNLVALRQGMDLCRSLGPKRYASVSPHLAHSGVGGHLRHVHDYYRCFLMGLGAGRVDYDNRERDERFETDLDYALAGVELTLERLQRLDANSGDLVLEVKMDAEPGEDEGAIWSRSTLRRELRFLLSHTIHHYALIRLLLAAEGVECDESFGVAPSTLEHWRHEPRCAPSPG